ncbi:MAG: CDP-alcohol phosphatidyltransferase family protein [Actinomycetes bacterium]
MFNKSPVSDRPKLASRDMSLALHAFTATGVLVGMAALVAVLDGSARLAIIWLLVAQLIDGIDGPLARRLLPEQATTKFDGYVLDLVIDFVTCVLVPAAFLWEFNMVNHDRSGMIAVAALLMFSCLWFSRTDQQDSESWFHGFPASWNMVVPTLWLLGSSHSVTLVVVACLSILTMTNVQFAHPIRVVQWRLWNVTAISVWVAGVLFGTIWSPGIPAPLIALIFLGPLMVAGATVARQIEVTRDVQLFRNR